MNVPFWNQVARRPRHRAEGGAEAMVEILRSSEQEPGVVEAELGDVSRNGAQLLVNQPLNDKEPVVMRIHCQESELDVRISGTVRWQRAEDASTWSIGCEFTNELEWEDYGELFLNGILESE